MPGRKYNAGSAYRYGFNGQEQSDEIFKGSTTAEFWEYDGRLGRRWNIDPITKYFESPYLCFSGNPIYYSDLLGNDPDPPTKNTTTEPKVDSKTMGGVTVSTSEKRGGFWNSRFGSFLKGVGKGIVVAAAVVVVAAAIVATAGAILPVAAAAFVSTAVTTTLVVGGVYATAKTVTELSTGRSNWGTGRKLGRNEKWDMGGQLLGGFIGGGATGKGLKLFRFSKGKASTTTDVTPIAETDPIPTNQSQPILEPPVATETNASVNNQAATVNVTKRPSNFRKQTTKDAWDQAEDGTTANTKKCSTCPSDVEGNPYLNERRDGPNGWDGDHQPQWQRRDLTGLDRAGVLDNYNEGVRLRCKGCNRADNQ